MPYNRKVPKWLKSFFDNPKSINTFNSSASIRRKINGVWVEVWFRKWFKKLQYKYQVHMKPRSPWLSKKELVHYLTKLSERDKDV